MKAPKLSKHKMDEYRTSIYKYFKMMCLMGFFLLASLLKAQDAIDLSGTWGFQTDVMDFRRGSLSPRYNHLLQETIKLPGI
ncbi:MAG: hypothetical protein WC589_11705, partial [Sphingobacterium sp.]